MYQYGDVPIYRGRVSHQPTPGLRGPFLKSEAFKSSSAGGGPASPQAPTSRSHIKKQPAAQQVLGVQKKKPARQRFPPPVSHFRRGGGANNNSPNKHEKGGVSQRCPVHPYQSMDDILRAVEAHHHYSSADPQDKMRCRGGGDSNSSISIKEEVLHPRRNNDHLLEMESSSSNLPTSTQGPSQFYHHFENPLFRDVTAGSILPYLNHKSQAAFRQVSYECFERYNLSVGLEQALGFPGVSCVGTRHGTLGLLRRTEQMSYPNNNDLLLAKKEEIGEEEEVFFPVAVSRAHRFPGALLLHLADIIPCCLRAALKGNGLLATKLVIHARMPYSGRRSEEGESRTWERLPKDFLPDADLLKTIPPNFLANTKALNEALFWGSELSSITDAGPRFLAECPGLERVRFYGLSGLTSVQSSWLKSCPKLKDVSFQGLTQLRNVGHSWMTFCSSVERVDVVESLPNLESVGDSWCCGCTKLQAITFRPVITTNKKSGGDENDGGLVFPNESSTSSPKSLPQQQVMITMISSSPLSSLQGLGELAFANTLLEESLTKSKKETDVAHITLKSLKSSLQ